MNVLTSEKKLQSIYVCCTKNIALNAMQNENLYT